MLWLYAALFLKGNQYPVFVKPGELSSMIMDFPPPPQICAWEDVELFCEETEVSKTKELTKSAPRRAVLRLE